MAQHGGPRRRRYRKAAPEETRLVGEASLVDEGGAEVEEDEEEDKGVRVEEEEEEDQVPEVGQEDAGWAKGYLKGVLAVLLVVWLVFDMLYMGLSKGSTPFVDWWDMVGTVSYIRGRHSSYSLRSKSSQRNAGWSAYVVLLAFLLYEVAGKLCRTIMRKSPQLPSLLGLITFCLQGLVPIHFSPGDFFFQTVEYDDVQQLIVCAYWGLTKVRSLHSVMKEAVHTHHYGLLPAFLLCMLSCEVASIISRADKTMTRYSFKTCLQRAPGGLVAWLTSKTFLSSIFISVFMIATMQAIKFPALWVVPNVLAYVACFYRYSNGLLERVIARTVQLPPLRHVKQVEAYAKEKAREAKEVVDRVPGEAPFWFLDASKGATRALAIGMDELAVVSKADLYEASSRLDELSVYLQTSQKAGKRSKKKTN